MYLVPDEFKHLDRPVCRLCRNLYGHKLAGLLWQKDAEDVIINKLKFETVQGWECLYFHRQKQLFLSVYVDDLKMAGKKENLAPMWELMGKHLELEPAKAMTTSQYLGCAQKDIVKRTWSE